ncbi:extracellular solute-binding protein [Streptomyces acidiscabies]|uniref:Extracellular solute-binding protein n=1 Tax=Streptomyces acidiscabies TaxID=42234 RepID=A0AAP6BBB4_9ACTN|nr:extracellular solute-binding protein [Streptomyces acidiscabies]MBP5938060.1 extracellular solute-binding protein [Streptomyces sp. LBUM 1476]MBZ3909068.1 extracellular solute-binding protein [Streptomyces acidiscabies]MDX2961605.1 extracellular solute-binding protein [Streptomyces acidiscabies]MDX3016527.1 extracellular solute-binding protein [Streptomyces acidiscabies]MDX3788568.1 extracellular solute-binding protein [Streptomyces acidiscabies]
MPHRISARSTRTAVAVLCAGGLALAASACSSASASGGSDHHLTAYVGGDTNIQTLWQDIVVPAFEKANPGYQVKVVYSAHGVADAATLAKLQAASKTKRDAGYDVIESSITPDAAAAGLLTTVSSKNVPNLAKVDPSLLGPVNNAAVPYRGSSVVLAYDSTKVKTPPKTYDDLVAWIRANPGKFAYNSPSTGGSGGSFVETTLDRHLDAATLKTFQTGYDAAQESKWDAGFSDLKGLNGYVYGKGVYPNGNQAVLDLLAKGQISIAPVWSDMYLSAVQNHTLDSTVKFTQISSPTFTGGAAYIGIPKGGTKQKAALKLADFFLEAAQQDAIVKNLAAYPVIPLTELPKATADRFAGVDVTKLRPGYSGKTGNDMNNLWQQKVPGQ